MMMVMATLFTDRVGRRMGTAFFSHCVSRRTAAALFTDSKRCRLRMCLGRGQQAERAKGDDARENAQQCTTRRDRLFCLNRAGGRCLIRLQHSPKRMLHRIFPVLVRREEILVVNSCERVKTNSNKKTRQF